MEIRQFDIYWVSLDPTQGSEIQKTRPAIIISPNEMNDFLQTVIIAPLTSVIRSSYVFRPEIKLFGRNGQVVCDQIRSVDISRLKNKMGEVPVEDRNKILEILQEMFA